MATPTDPQSGSIGIGGSPAPAGAGDAKPAVDPAVATPPMPAVEKADTSLPSGDMKIAGDVTPAKAQAEPVTTVPGNTPQPATPAPQMTETLPPIPAEIPASEASKETSDAKAENNGDDDENEEESEPQVVERVIIKEKGGGVGCFGLLRNLTCIVISIILLLIAAVVAVVIFKPSFITEPLKVFLNADYKPADVAEGISSDTVKNYIDEVTNTTDGEVTFQITEDQLTTLVREKFDDDVDVRTGMEENKLQLFIDIAQKGEPLWLIIELSDSGDNLTFSRIGFGRINTPAGLRDFVKEQAFGLIGNVLKDFNFDNSENFAGNFVTGELREGVSIKEVKFAPDLMLVTVEL